ncbi:ABC transporter substrate-binding protein [Streptomyces otsuchiensis]|uniref:ABC transporter substrate-binding protein n=1 Tax=Streptomyces otsuchiensis TaxID=2681388 RepID=UPI001030252C|nr:iron-siderophore ABC transporter substrate-binding protein [Streptomyces otsuchiensis]
MNRHTTPRAGRSARRASAATALALVSALTLTACGGSSGDGDSSDGAGDGDSGGTRTVETAMGPVEVPENPLRVVVLDTPELDSMLTLGVKPVGAVRADAADGFLGYLPSDFTEGIEDVGNIAAPNLEAIHDLDPDLIIGNIVRDEERYDELSAIAPTVFGERPGGPWKENFLLHAAALNKEDEAELAVAGYEAQVAEVTEALGGPDVAADTEVSVLRFIEGADSRIYATDNYIATLLADIGVARPAITEESEDGFMVEISSEQIDLADADVLYYSSYGDAATSGEGAMVGSPLWEGMTAVSEGRAHHIDDELWFLGIGYTAAEEVLRQLAETLPE